MKFIKPGHTQKAIAPLTFACQNHNNFCFTLWLSVIKNNYVLFVPDSFKSIMSNRYHPFFTVGAQFYGMPQSNSIAYASLGKSYFSHIKAT